jgi:spore germination cell wall hydrolase CwlJ-like protein
VALTIFGEAAGESIEGKRAVASVIWTRADGNPNALASVCKAPRQFSCWNDGAPLVPDDAPSRRAYVECVKIASAMATGAFTPTLRATHYHAGKAPKWAGSMRLVAVIGGHRFYMEVANG